jgi:superfamily II DNA/RNA helicase
MDLNGNKKRIHDDPDSLPKKKPRSADGTTRTRDESPSPSLEDDETGLKQDQSAGLPAETAVSFADLQLSERTMAAIETMGFSTMTNIQRRVCIPTLLIFSPQH